MIAASGCYQARDAAGRPEEFSGIHHSSASFECPGRCVVLVFDPDIASDALSDQGPLDLRGGLHDRIDEFLSGANFFYMWQ
jgi:hypothetical protein